MFAMPVVAFGLGAFYKRKFSIIALICVLALVAATSFMAQYALARSGQPGWQFAADHPWPITIGMSLVFSALALVGPIFSERWERAFSVSLILVLVFLLTQLPVMFTACVLFGACI